MTMEGFTIIDGVVAGLIVLSALLAYGRGLVREALAIGGWIVSGLVAFAFAPQVEPLVKELPVLGDFLAQSCQIAMVVAFAVILAFCLVIVGFFTPLLTSLIKDSALGPIDKGLGFLFGVARGVLLAAIGFFVANLIFPNALPPIMAEARSADVFLQFNQNIEDSNPEAAMGWITRQSEVFLSACDAPSGRDA
jgi:membrane protein required for colicin V production